jgi:hypothetical protein
MWIHAGLLEGEKEEEIELKIFLESTGVLVFQINISPLLLKVSTVKTNTTTDCEKLNLRIKKEAGLPNTILF